LAGLAVTTGLAGTTGTGYAAFESAYFLAFCSLAN